MLSCAIRNRRFTSRKLKKCALVHLVCTNRVQLPNFFRSYAAIVLVSTGTHMKTLKGP